MLSCTLSRQFHTVRWKKQANERRQRNEKRKEVVMPIPVTTPPQTQSLQKEPKPSKLRNRKSYYSSSPQRSAVEAQRLLLLEVIAPASALHFNGGQISSETAVTRRRVLALGDQVHAGRRLELEHSVFGAIVRVVHTEL